MPDPGNKSCSEYSMKKYFPLLLSFLCLLVFSLSNPTHTNSHVTHSQKTKKYVNKICILVLEPSPSNHQVDCRKDFPSFFHSLSFSESCLQSCSSSSGWKIKLGGALFVVLLAITIACVADGYHKINEGNVGIYYKFGALQVVS